MKIANLPLVLILLGGIAASGQERKPDDFESFAAVRNPFAGSLRSISTQVGTRKPLVGLAI